MTDEQQQEREQSINAARGAAEWLKNYIVHTKREPLEAPIMFLIKGFEVLDEETRKATRLEVKNYE